MARMGERPSRALHQWRARLRNLPLRTRRMGGRVAGGRMEELGNRHQRARTLRRFVASSGRKIYPSSLISGGGPAATAPCHPCRISWRLDSCRRSTAWRRAMRRLCSAAPGGWVIPSRRRWRMCFGRVLPDRHDEPRGADEEPQDEVLRRGGKRDVHIALKPRERGLHADAAKAAAPGGVRSADGLPARLDRHPVERQAARGGRTPPPRLRQLDVRERDALGGRAHRRRRKRKGV